MISTTTPHAWTELLQLPLHQRLLPLPPAVRDFVHQVNVATGVDAVPEALPVDAALRADLEAALAGMPERVRVLVAPRLLGICIGRGLGSCGITDIVLDANDNGLLGCIVLLDAELMEGRGANAWASWKGNLPFYADSGFTLDTCIAAEHDDTRAGALQFLLLHEFGHVLGADGDFLPRWWEAPPARTFPFLDLGWTLNAAGRFVPHAGCDFELRGVVDFYGANKLASEALVTAYAGLELSEFPSLYGATNPYDDFAESFATWVHTQMLGRPHVVRIDYDGAPQAWLEPYWDSARSAARRAFMESLLGKAEEIGAAQELMAA